MRVCALVYFALEDGHSPSPTSAILPVVKVSSTNDCSYERVERRGKQLSAENYTQV